MMVFLIIKPFLGKKTGATKAEVLSRVVEHGAMKDAAAQMPQVSYDTLDRIFRESQAERLRLQ